MAYRQLLGGRKINCSMSTKGCCRDNTLVESFFSTPKHELELDDDAVTLNSPQQLIRHLALWIDRYLHLIAVISSVLQGARHLCMGPIMLLLRECWSVNHYDRV
jgi:transposase InsO family protein